jgi:hypothetical protein
MPLNMTDGTEDPEEDAAEAQEPGEDTATTSED